jgi:hypothetical protein
MAAESAETVAQTHAAQVAALKEDALVQARTRDRICEELESTQRRVELLQEQVSAAHSEQEGLAAASAARLIALERRNTVLETAVAAAEAEAAAATSAAAAAAAAMADTNTEAEAKVEAEAGVLSVSSEYWVDSLWPSFVEVLQMMDAAVGLARSAGRASDGDKGGGEEGVDRGDGLSESFVRDSYYVELASTTGTHAALEGDIQDQVEFLLSALMDCTQALEASADACTDMADDLKESAAAPVASALLEQPAGTVARMVEVSLLCLLLPYDL